MRRCAWLAAVLTCLAPIAARAVQVDALETGREWRLRSLRFEGNQAVKDADLREPLATTERTWFALWRDYPEFDPIAFEADLDRVRALYRGLGYYHARVEHDIELPAEGDEITAVVYIEEGPPVYVVDVHVDLAGATLPEAERTRLLEDLPVARTRVFTEEAYNRAYAYLRTYYREHGYARVEVTKTATVDVASNEARLVYRVTSGPPCVFGDTSVDGNVDVDTEVVRRELAYDPGDAFKQSLIERTRTNLVALRLFRSVQIDEERGRDDRVDLHVHVVEQPPREIRLGVGYDTEEQARLLASWRNYNDHAGARQLGFTARVSFIKRTIAADFLQPHFPGQQNRTRLLLSEEQEEEDAFTLDRSRFSPRLEWQATPQVTGFAFYRVEYDVLTSVSEAIKKDFPGIAPHTGILSGLGTGAEWNTTDDLLDPTRGWTVRGTVEPVGGVLGGNFTFLRVITEGRFYTPLVARFLGAARVRVGSADPLGSGEIPLFERFYAGGVNSVRGYGRWRIGPLVNDEPVGGRSIVEASIELRHPITETIGAAVFVDAGQVSVKSWDFPFGDLRYGSGFGVRYKSPVGPIAVDLGFPVEPPPGDAHWQVSVSVGAGF
jgi:outer membrane protein assembly complex protein YaeT